MYTIVLYCAVPYHAPTVSVGVYAYQSGAGSGLKGVTLSIRQNSCGCQFSPRIANLCTFSCPACKSIGRDSTTVVMSVASTGNFVFQHFGGVPLL